MTPIDTVGDIVTRIEWLLDREDWDMLAELEADPPEGDAAPGDLHRLQHLLTRVESLTSRVESRLDAVRSEFAQSSRTRTAARSYLSTLPVPDAFAPTNPVHST